MGTRSQKKTQPSSKKKKTHFIFGWPIYVWFFMRTWKQMR